MTGPPGEEPGQVELLDGSGSVNAKKSMNKWDGMSKVEWRSGGGGGGRGIWDNIYM